MLNISFTLVPIKFIFILFFLKTFAQCNNLPIELKIQVQWRHIPQFEFLEKFALKNGSNDQRFELSLFRVSYSIDRQFGRAFGPPIATTKSMHYDLARLLIGPQENVGEMMGEEERRKREKGKEIMGEGNEQRGDEFELQIKMIFGGIWNNQTIIKRLKTLPEENKILICLFEVAVDGCFPVEYIAKEFHQPQRRIFFELNVQEAEKLRLEKIECTRMAGHFLEGLERHAAGIGYFYMGPVCPLDKYTLHLSFSNNPISLPYNCDEAIYADVTKEMNTYYFKNHADGRLECKLRIDELEGDGEKGLVTEIEENEGQLRIMELQMQPQLWKYFYKQIKTLKKYGQIVEALEIILTAKNLPEERKTEIGDEIKRMKQLLEEGKSMLPTLYGAMENWQNLFMKISPSAAPKIPPTLTRLADAPSHSKDSEDNLLALTLGQDSPNYGGKKIAWESSSSLAVDALLEQLMPKSRIGQSSTNDEDGPPSPPMSVMDLLNLPEEAKEKKIRYMIGKFMKVPTESPLSPQPLDRQHAPMPSMAPSKNVHQLTQILQNALLSASNLPHSSKHLSHRQGHPVLDTSIGQTSLFHPMLSQPLIPGGDPQLLKNLKEAYRAVSQNLEHLKKSPKPPRPPKTPRQMLRMMPQGDPMQIERPQQQESPPAAGQSAPDLGLHLGLTHAANIPSSAGMSSSSQHIKSAFRPPKLQIQRPNEQEMAAKFSQPPRQKHNSGPEEQHQLSGMPSEGQIPSNILTDQIHHQQIPGPSPANPPTEKSSTQKWIPDLQFQISDFYPHQKEGGSSSGTQQGHSQGHIHQQHSDANEDQRTHHFQRQHSDISLGGIQRQFSDSLQTQREGPPSEAGQNPFDMPVAFSQQLPQRKRQYLRQHSDLSQAYVPRRIYDITTSLARENDIPEGSAAENLKLNSSQHIIEMQGQSPQNVPSTELGLSPSGMPQQIQHSSRPSPLSDKGKKNGDKGQREHWNEVEIIPKEHWMASSRKPTQASGSGQEQQHQFPPALGQIEQHHLNLPSAGKSPKTQMHPSETVATHSNVQQSEKRSFEPEGSIDKFAQQLEEELSPDSQMAEKGHFRKRVPNEGDGGNGEGGGEGPTKSSKKAKKDKNGEEGSGGKGHQ